ncbi:MAG: PQQ-binding-like beta-propeller repeat protein [Bacteroidota bacterium]|jgi:outer membrane protein assembly factor BamB
MNIPNALIKELKNELNLKILLLFIISNLFVYGQDWNISRGGNTQRNGLTNQYGPSDTTLLWSGGLSSVIAEPPVSDSIYLAAVRISNIGNFLQGSRIVMMDIRNGDTLWTHNLPVDFPTTDWFNKISALKDGVLYASRSGNNNKSYLYALNASNGSILWRSDSLIDESSSEGLNFLANGDLIVGNIYSVLRINKNNGSTVWKTTRLSYQDGAEVSIYGSKFYGIINDFQNVKLAAYDTSTGQLLYKSPSLGGGLIQQQGLFIGTNGTIYFPRSQNNPVTDSLYSFTDNGSSFVRNWSVPIHYVPFSSGGVGNDGTVYTYGRNGNVIRLDPSSGVLIDSSMVVLYGDATYPRMNIDAAGRVYVSNGGFSDGHFYSFNSDLTLRWQTPLQNVFIGGPIIGWDGILILCGIGNNIRAYKGDIALTNQPINFSNQTENLNLFPNPTSDKINLKINASLIGSKYLVYDNIGNIVSKDKITSENIEIDLSKLLPGIYFLGIENKISNYVKLIKE